MASIIELLAIEHIIQSPIHGILLHRSDTGLEQHVAGHTDLGQSTVNPGDSVLPTLPEWRVIFLFFPEREMGKLLNCQFLSHFFRWRHRLRFWLDTLYACHFVTYIAPDWFIGAYI